MTVAFVLSGLVALGAIGLALRRVPPAPARRTTIRFVAERRPIERNRARRLAIVWFVLCIVLIGPSAVLWAAVAAGVLWSTRRRDLAALTALATLVTVAAYVVLNERRWSPLPDGGWPGHFEKVHGVGVFAVVALIVAALVADDDHDEGEIGSS